MVDTHVLVSPRFEALIFPLFPTALLSTKHKIPIVFPITPLQIVNAENFRVLQPQIGGVGDVCALAEVLMPSG
jgi:hypothetical protein